MAVERTLAIIKPDATERNLIGQIMAKIEESGLRVIAMKMVRMSLERAKAFYAVHAERSFYDDLCEYMASGPVVVMVLEGENAIERYRELMGATNPANAAEGTIRKMYGRDVQANAVHGSDSAENANQEIHFFFSDAELVR